MKYSNNQEFLDDVDSKYKELSKIYNEIYTDNASQVDFNKFILVRVSALEVLVDKIVNKSLYDTITGDNK